MIGSLKHLFALVAQAAAAAGITVSWEMDQSGELHARQILTDNGWRIALDSGLDVFQRFEWNEAFSLTSRLKSFRPVKRFEVIYIRS
jgi:ATP-dependent Lon protease